MHAPRLQRRDRIANRADVLRGGTATTPDDVDQPFSSELVQQTAGDIRCFIETGFAHGIGQTRVRVAADERVTGHLGQLLYVRPHQRRTQSAIETNGQRFGMPHAVLVIGKNLFNLVIPFCSGLDFCDNAGCINDNG